MRGSATPPASRTARPTICEQKKITFSASPHSPALAPAVPRQTLGSVRQLLDALLGGGRLKKDLGADLPPPHKKSCRTAANRALRAESALEAEERVAQVAAHREAQVQRASRPRVGLRVRHGLCCRVGEWVALVPEGFY
eukprot:scaffold21150_cov129-Isochrysis_galbana.AAC.3